MLQLYRLGPHGMRLDWSRQAVSLARLADPRQGGRVSGHTGHKHDPGSLNFKPDRSYPWLCRLNSRLGGPYPQRKTEKRMDEKVIYD